MLLRVILFSFLLLLVSPVAHAEKRVALVIGNSAYRYAGELVNPRNDAIDVAAALERHGFAVVLGLDLTKPGWSKNFVISRIPYAAPRWVCFSTLGMACRCLGRTTSYPPMPNC